MEYNKLRTQKLEQNKQLEKDKLQKIADSKDVGTPVQLTSLIEEVS